MRILDAETLFAALDYPSAVAALEEAWRGTATVPPRMQVQVGEGRMWVMPAVAGSSLGVKVVTQFDANAARGLERIQGSYLYLDGETGAPLALLDGRVLTAIRTAAVSALATRYLKNPGPAVLAIFGAGAQARSHLAGMRACFEIQEVMVCGATAEASRAFAAEHDVRPATAEQACQADLICACTTSRSPLWDGAWLRPGAHINAVGNSRPDACELDATTVHRARIVADTRAGVLEEAGDILLHGAQDAIVAELADLVRGEKQVRQSPEEITLFKSVGYALGDLALARLAYSRCS